MTKAATAEGRASLPPSSASPRLSHFGGGGARANTSGAPPAPPPPPLRPRPRAPATARAIRKRCCRGMRDGRCSEHRSPVGILPPPTTCARGLPSIVCRHWPAGHQRLEATLFSSAGGIPRARTILPYRFLSRRFWPWPDHHWPPAWGRPKLTSALFSLFLPFARAEAQRQVAAATLHYLEYASNRMNVFYVVRRTEPSSQSAKCHAGASRALVLDSSHVIWHFPPSVFCTLVLQTFCHASLLVGINRCSC